MKLEESITLKNDVHQLISTTLQTMGCKLPPLQIQQALDKFDENLDFIKAATADLENSVTQNREQLVRYFDGQLSTYHDYLTTQVSDPLRLIQWAFHEFDDVDTLTRSLLTGAAYFITPNVKYYTVDLRFVYLAGFALAPHDTVWYVPSTSEEMLRNYMGYILKEILINGHQIDFAYNISLFVEMVSNLPKERQSEFMLAIREHASFRYLDQHADSTIVLFAYFDRFAHKFYTDVVLENMAYFFNIDSLERLHGDIKTTFAENIYEANEANTQAIIERYRNDVINANRHNNLSVARSFYKRDEIAKAMINHQRN